MGGSALGVRMAVAVAGLIVAGCAAPTPKPAPQSVWPLPPETPRIKYLESYSTRGHFGASGSNRLKEALLGEDPTSRERMVKPYAVVADARGRVYVSDTGLGQVWVFDSEARRVRFIGDAGQVRLATPSGLAVDARGILYVADTKLDRVFAFDPSGNLVLAIGDKDGLVNPSGLALDAASGHLYVAETGRHRIRVYESATGRLLTEFGARGAEPGRFNFPTHVFLREGRLYVTDTMNFRVQVFDLDGRLLRSFGEMGASLGQFARPKGVAVDSEQNVYVVDAAFSNLQVFNARGELLLFVGRVGTEIGEFWLPAGAYIDHRDRIYVVDQYNRRVQVFQYLSQRGTATNARIDSK